MVIFLYAMLYLFVFVIGLCIGSFSNVLIYRVPNKIGFVKGRSFCPNCHHTLGPLDLVPLFSWLLLKGRCRYCSNKISVRYPLVELIGGIAAVLSVAVFWVTPKAAIVFVSAVILTVIAFIDADTMEIPDGLVIALAIVAAGAAFAFSEVSLLCRTIGLFAVSIPMLLINLIVKTSFGGGDIKLVAVCGFLLGWKQLLVGTFIALLLGGGYGMYLLKSKKKGRKDHFAFGPCLSIGMILALFCGETLLTAYLSLFV